MPKVTAAVLAALVAVTIAGCAGTPAEANPTQLTPAETDYLGVVKVTTGRTDAELLEAGYAACDQIRNGRDIFQVHVFDDDTNSGGFYEDSVRVALAAAPRLCPDVG